MRETTYNKLVRDNIPDIIAASGKSCETEILDDHEYKVMLDKKLDEELAEYHHDRNVEELADLLEVIYSIAAISGYSVEDLEKIRKTKVAKRGSFTKRILLKKVFEA